MKCEWMHSTSWCGEIRVHRLIALKKKMDYIKTKHLHGQNIINKTERPTLPWKKYFETYEDEGNFLEV